jgi:polygalacturonase
LTTPANFGAKGDGITNDTTAIQAFLNALAKGGFGYWNNASYLVNEVFGTSFRTWFAS